MGSRWKGDVAAAPVVKAGRKSDWVVVDPSKAQLASGSTLRTLCCNRRDLSSCGSNQTDTHLAHALYACMAYTDIFSSSLL
jgi:hypothetical protein